MTKETAYEHILLDEKGVPMIEGTTMKVVELVLNHLSHGWSPEELHFQHPYLGMGQIHSALAYYWDHKEAIDCDIQRRKDLIEKIRESLPPSPLQEKLKGLAGS
ncbi:MAG: DUF433 domain-containing protein [Candidatus Omnitrophica bacterium]|nr:DUF433 domain-containing protein [Candidatus Omnitrophota bacterium]MCA9415854.1 DUF433 domain-containing protein [Candidatus Omnitrophota bacterium]MCA9423827.1 DUF433 domain-containing protein [Candidatus Omnitrophota bacterium]MCA9434198.1 DUF433 domain-containing protein [Candidatus Omnitrophota bacterium]MCA9443743.1 DUF433 domain-containing protein [Candidatus Omnitrophota bacterium]